MDFTAAFHPFKVFLSGINEIHNMSIGFIMKLEIASAAFDLRSYSISTLAIKTVFVGCRAGWSYIHIFSRSLTKQKYVVFYSSKPYTRHRELPFSG